MKLYAKEFEENDDFLADLRELGLAEDIINILLGRHRARIEAGRYREAIRGLEIILLVDPDNEQARSLRDRALEALEGEGSL